MYSYDAASLSHTTIALGELDAVSVLSVFVLYLEKGRSNTDQPNNELEWGPANTFKVVRQSHNNKQPTPPVSNGLVEGTLGYKVTTIGRL